MNVKAVIEISILLNRLRNIQLYQQGMYQLEFECFTIQNNEVIKAKPMCSESLNPSTNTADLHNIRQGTLNEKNSSIKTKIFALRASDDKVKIQEILTFYLEIDANHEEFPPIFIQSSLLYSNISRQSFLAKNLNSLVLDCTKIVKIQNPGRGILSFLPLNFDSKSFICVEGIVAVCLYDLVFSSEDVSDFACYLFPDKKGKIKKMIGGQEIDRKYSQVVSKLVNCRNYLTKSFENILIECEILLGNGISSLHLPVSFEQPDFSKSFAENLKTHDALTISNQIKSEIKLISFNVYEAFNLIKYQLSIHLKQFTSYLRQSYLKSLSTKFSEFIIKSEEKSTIDLLEISEDPTSHLKKAKSLRKSEYFLNSEPLEIQEQDLLPKMSQIPIIFEEKFIPPKPNKSHPKASSHLIVLVHGFQGNSFDMQSLKIILDQIYPSLLILDSTFNENKTEGDIREMGDRLAQEVITSISYNFPDNPPLISFIGHSLGGLIIRAALPLLETFSNNFFTFMTLSTPHLGLLYSSKLLGTGIWLINRVKSFESLDQICFKDCENLQESTLFNLSTANGLQWFEYVVLVGSAQDEYAPISSARIEICEKSWKDQKNGPRYRKMAQNLLERISVTNVIKIDAHFQLNQSIDTIIGRSAHIQLLENQEFLKTLVYSYPELFIKLSNA